MNNFQMQKKLNYISRKKFAKRLWEAQSFLAFWHRHRPNRLTLHKRTGQLDANGSRIGLKKAIHQAAGGQHPHLFAINAHSRERGGKQRSCWNIFKTDHPNVLWASLACFL